MIYDCPKIRECDYVCHTLLVYYANAVVSLNMHARTHAHSHRVAHVHLTYVNLNGNIQPIDAI